MTQPVTARADVLPRPLAMVVFFLEKNWRHGVMFARVAGVACLVLGAGVVLDLAKPAI